MNDLISRAKLFNKLAVIKAPPEANEYKGEVYSVIQAMETADDGWIPVSERLPEIGIDVLVSHGNYVSITSLEGNFDCVWWDDFSDLENSAWMPLPEPYRQDGEAERKEE